MQPSPIDSPTAAAALLDRVLTAISWFTLALTIPQVVNVWSSSKASGVSAVSWGAYLISAVVWLVYGIRKRDRHIYLPCIGWIVLDAAIIAGVIVNR